MKFRKGKIKILILTFLLIKLSSNCIYAIELNNKKIEKEKEI